MGDLVEVGDDFGGNAGVVFFAAANRPFDEAPGVDLAGLTLGGVAETAQIVDDIADSIDTPLDLGDRIADIVEDFLGGLLERALTRL